MKIFRLVSASLTVIALGLPCMAASAGEIALPVDLGGMRVPRWMFGQLLLLNDEHTPSATLRRIGLDGAEQAPQPITVNGANFLTVHDFARGKDGTIAACGLALDPSGRKANYLFISSSRGQTAIRTDPYYPNNVAVTDDGSVWTSGFEAVDEPDPAKRVHGKPLSPAPFAIRRFDKSGHFEAGYLPQGEISSAPNLWAAHPVISLSAAGNRVVWFSVGEARMLVFESNALISDYKTVDLPSPWYRVTGVALTQSGGFYLSTAESDVHTLWRFEGQKRAFRNVAVPHAGVLYGAEGEELITRGTGQESVLYRNAL